MSSLLQTLIEAKTIPADERTQIITDIHDLIIHKSKYIDAPNFNTIHPDDIERLFDLYDVRFFDGECRKALGKTSIDFRLSKRMTQAGGKAIRKQFPDANGNYVDTEYEIAVSTTLLFQTFREDHRPVKMSGIECRNRLEALQRVMEHEMVHLIEMLIWNKSSCNAPRFQTIANRFFGHTDHRHQLITPREHAYTKFGIKVGDRVSFEMEGRTYVGVVNRITRRATVLVENANGVRYSDGKCYAKFYVPVQMLQAVAQY